MTTTLATMQQQNQKQLQQSIASGQITGFVSPPPDDISGDISDSVASPDANSVAESDSINPSDAVLYPPNPSTGFCFDANLASPAKTAAQFDVGSTVSNSDIVGGELDF